MKKVIAYAVLMLVFVLTACGAESETVEVTVEVPVEVTRIVSEVAEVEVTRVVTEVVEVEVTRLFEVEVEVTRVVEVEKLITATPKPTDEIIPTATPTSPPITYEIPVNRISDSLLISMKTVRGDLRDLGGMLDGTSSMSAQRIVEIYDRVNASPTYDVTGENLTVQTAHANYRSAVSIFTTSSRDLALHAKDFLASGADSSSIPFQQWGVARQSINNALDILNPAIESLE